MAPVVAQKDTHVQAMLLVARNGVGAVQQLSTVQLDVSQLLELARHSQPQPRHQLQRQDQHRRRRRRRHLLE